MKRVWQGVTLHAATNAGIVAALPSVSRAMAISIANQAECEALVAECAFTGVLVDKSLPLVELRERRDAALRGGKMIDQAEIESLDDNKDERATLRGTSQCDGTCDPQCQWCLVAHHCPDECAGHDCPYDALIEGAKAREPFFVWSWPLLSAILAAGYARSVTWALVAALVAGYVRAAYDSRSDRA